ncbi:MAG: TIGR04255 family protein [Planctomycetes bacterium]|nr:TIGR04255 family protein [Planctomycetota bacterium]
MPEVRTLKNPPITEGLIDLRVDACKFSREKLAGIADSVRTDYPHRVEQRQFQTKLEAIGEEPPKAQTRDLGLLGGRFFSADKLQVAQFRSDGFTLNRLRPYTGWDTVFPEAMKLWRLFVDVFEPETVKRVAVRYINHIRLQGMHVELGQYLRSPIPVPAELDHDLTGFLTSVVIRDPESHSLVKVTQSLEPPHPASDLVLLFDIEAWEHGEWSPMDAGIEATLTHLRALKNKAFFSSLTESTLASFG